MADQKKSKKKVNDKHMLMANMASTVGWIQNNYTQFLKPFGISSPQFNILRILRGAGEWLTMSVVKERMVDKAPNATRLADKLIAQQLIERRGSTTDRRVVHVNITKLGLALLKKIDDNKGPEQNGFLDKITMKEAKIANDIIAKLRK